MEMVDKYFTNQDLAELMSQLHGQGISITSMRNRENRLEQMFVSLLAQAS